MKMIKPTAIIGGGFTGLAAGLRLAQKGVPVVIYEADDDIGGLAGSFKVNGVNLEKFYHHWFNNDKYILELANELSAQDNVIIRESSTGLYFNETFYRLSTPLDVLKFSPLPFLDRIRLGLLVFQVSFFKDWRKIEHLNIPEWLIPLCGEKVYKTVWEPLVKAKFSKFYEEITAVWFWKKLHLRGGSRGNGGAENLAYYKGGFAALAEHMQAEIEKLGGKVFLNSPVTDIKVDGDVVTQIISNDVKQDVSQVIATTALPIISNILKNHATEDYLSTLNRVNYLANKCLVLVLDRSLSDLYWINVNDPSFPFVGVIEHTNFEPPETYSGKHIVYLSRYLTENDPVYEMSAEELFDYALPYIKKMFPDFDEKWVMELHSWKAPYAQPVTERGYSDYVPGHATPYKNLSIYTMAQIYPQDRGTNYAIREGWAAADDVVRKVRS
jgi:protoporphyrinogen oxidase